MHRLFFIVLLLMYAVSAAVLPAEEPVPDSEQVEDAAEPPIEASPLQELFPRFKGQAVVLDINARVVEQNQTVIWNESHRKATIPGRPVGIKLIGANVVVAAQFTPYIRRGARKFLVAQGQIWMDIPNQGIRYQTSMQTIPLEYEEPVYFFPFGQLGDDDTACIEVILTLHPYEEE
ncbi:MAG: hypothetical protein FWH38_02465 [Treponema sp.]|nr:hypothetical protein [Treponema sp.]